LRTPVRLYGEDLKTVGEFAEAGQSIPFVLSYDASFQNPPPAIDGTGRRNRSGGRILQNSLLISLGNLLWRLVRS